MFKEIFRFELSYGFKRIATYIYFLVLFSLGLLYGLLAAGVFNLPKSDSNILVNSAYVVTNILLSGSSSFIGLISNIFLISIFGSVIQRDFEHNVHSLFYTKPVTKPGYFWGRFGGAFVIALFVFSGLMLGYMTGTLFGLGKPMMGPFELKNFLVPFLSFTIPNLFLFGIIFFGVATYSRSLMPAYIVAILIMVLQIVASLIVSNIDYKNLAALIEPTGANAVRLLTQYWTPDEKNANFVHFEGILLKNRMIWLGAAALIAAACYYFFSFSQYLQPFRLFKRKTKEATATHAGYHSLADIPKASQDFSLRNWINQVLFLSHKEFRRVIISPFFLIMAALGLIIMIIALLFMDRMYDSSVYPVTYKVIDAASVLPGMLTLFILFYTGTVTWRDKETKMDELVGVTPVSNLQLMVSRMAGIAMAIAIFSVLGALLGIAYQVYNGFYDISPGQYIMFILSSFLFGFMFSGFNLALQALSPNKILGFVIVLVVLMGIPLLFDALDWNSTFVSVGSDGPSLPYSDMNGNANNLLISPFYKTYWFSITGLLMLLGAILYQRGKEKNYKARWRLGSADFDKKNSLAAGLFGILALAAAGFIAYEVFYLNDNTKSKEIEKELVAAERKYKHFEKSPQPRITSSKIAVDLFTKKNTAHFAGQYILKNLSGKNIDTLFIHYAGGRKSNFKFSKLSPSVPFNIISNDSVIGIRLLKLSSPLLPGDSINFDFDFSYTPKGLFGRNDGFILGNGTFLNNFIFPTIGYSDRMELSENVARKDYGLMWKDRMAAINDSAGRMKNYISQDADWINFEATVSTDEGQTAIAPGYLQKEWKENGRHYFQYKMDSPILNFYSILSADYTIKRDKWKDVNIEIYYQKGHEYNIGRMISAIKKSLDYYTANFGPYQHRQVRIIEFPRYAGFAQSFPNTIPYSEAIGFITKVSDKPGEIDVPFYVTAHEVAHQWWGHQVVGGNVQGSVLMSETMSQYSALMVMEKTYGKEAMKKFLKYEMDNYLRGRTFERVKELPLMLCENQQYIHYNKGSVVMYALKEYLGEEKLNSAIRSYLERNKFKGPMYTNAIEFVQAIKAVTPDSLQYFVTDQFEKITLYENYVKAFKVTPLPNNEWKVSMTVGMAKFYSNATGKETKVQQLNDYVDIGIFGESSKTDSLTLKPILIKRVKMTNSEETFYFTVNKKPGSGGIDPYLLLIDKTPDNNMLKEGETPKPPKLKEGEKAISISF